MPLDSPAGNGFSPGWLSAPPEGSSAVRTLTRPHCATRAGSRKVAAAPGAFSWEPSGKSPALTTGRWAIVLTPLAAERRQREAEVELSSSRVGRALQGEVGREGRVLRSSRLAVDYPGQFALGGCEVSEEDKGMLRT